MAAAAATLAAGAAGANPTGGVVTAGQATIVQVSPILTKIIETSPKAIISWTNFVIPAGSTVDVVQPGASAILLNHVTSGLASFGGTFTANGQVWFSAPAGIAVAPGARIAAAGLILTTASLGDADFTAGNYSFGIPGAAGAKIVNQGTISVSGGGAAVLAGASVDNQGIVEADLGTVMLGGAKTFAVDFDGDGLLRFAVTAPVDQAVPGAQAVLNNSGTLSAPGGKVLMTAAAATGIIDSIINSTGIIEATRAANIDGQIVLSGSGGAVNIAGSLNASGALSVKGDSITVADGTSLMSESITLDATGSVSFGGNILPPGDGGITDDGAITIGTGDGVVVTDAIFALPPSPPVFASVPPKPPLPLAIAGQMIATKSLPVTLAPPFKPPPVLDMSQLSPPDDPIAPSR